MKRLFALLLVFAILFAGCTNEKQTLKKENEQLKSRVSELEKNVDSGKRETTSSSGKMPDNLTINYMENTDNKRFVEKKSNILGLPVEGAIRLNEIGEKTVIDVLDTASVDNVIWLYIAIPVYDSPSNCKGWIKESDTVKYTKEKINSVLGDIKIRTGEYEYETYDFAGVRTVKPYKAQEGEHGRIDDKQDGYVRLMCPGGKVVWMKESSIIYPSVE